MEKFVLVFLERMRGNDIHIEKIWMENIRRNDYISYRYLFDRYYTPLCQYVYGLLMNQDDAEDVVQELFLNLWKNRDKIEVRENVSGYLYRAAKHLTLNLLRSRPSMEALDGQEIISSFYEENRLEAEEFRVALYGCIDRLPDRSREVLLLHRLEGLKQQEIADRLSITVKTIKNLIWTSLRRLRECLEKKEIIK